MNPSDYNQSRYQYLEIPDQETHRNHVAHMISLIHKFSRKNLQTWLDVGCGKGHFLEAIKTSTSLTVTGVDRDPSLVAMAQEKTGAHITCMDILEKDNNQLGPFDVISACEIFEHLSSDQHAQLLQSFRRWGTTQSVGLILVPNAAHPLMGPYLTYSDYTHKFHFTPESLSQMLRSNGFSDIQITPWFLGGNRVIKSGRQVAGRVVGSLFKILLWSFSSRLKSNDPAVRDPLPFSSHLLALFRINSQDTKT